MQKKMSLNMDKIKQRNRGKGRKYSKEQVAEFHFTWVLVLWTGLLIFQAIDGLKDHLFGAIALVCYLTGTLYFTISSLPYFVVYVLDKLPLTKNNQDAANINSQ